MPEPVLTPAPVRILIEPESARKEVNAACGGDIRPLQHPAKDLASPADNQIMKHGDSQHIGDTIRIRRPPRVFTDALGHNTWMGGVDPCELDLETDAANTDPYNSVGTESRPLSA